VFSHKLQQTSLHVLILGMQVVVLINESFPFISSIICSPYIFDNFQKTIKAPFSTALDLFAGSRCQFREVQIKRYVSLT